RCGTERALARREAEKASLDRPAHAAGRSVLSLTSHRSASRELADQREVDVGRARSLRRMAREAFRRRPCPLFLACWWVTGGNRWHIACLSRVPFNGRTTACGYAPLSQRSLQWAHSGPCISSRSWRLRRERRPARSRSGRPRLRSLCCGLSGFGAADASR